MTLKTKSYTRPKQYSDGWSGEGIGLPVGGHGEKEGRFRQKLGE